MQKISDKNAALAKEARDLLIKEAGRCEDRQQLEDTAVNILSKFASMPGIARRVCESFNSGKSVYKFTSGNDQTRPEDFAILDVDRVCDRIVKQACAQEFSKTASFAPKFGTVELPVAIMKKTASAEEPSKTPAEYLEMDFRRPMLPITLNNVLTHQCDLFHKLASAFADARMAKANALDTLAREASHMSKEARAEVSSIGSAYYKEFFNEASELFKTDLPLRKFASTPQIPNTPVFDKLEDFAEKSYICDNYQELIKTAAADICNNVRRLAGAYRIFRLMEKKAAGMNDMLTGALAGTVLPEAFGLSAGSKKDIYNELRNPNVENVLRELEMKRNFYEVYADDYISSFPLEQVQDAYNAAIQKLPDKLKSHPSSATQLIRSWVTKTLSHGGVVSAEDAADVMEAADKMRGETGGVGNPYNA